MSETLPAHEQEGKNTTKGNISLMPAVNRWNNISSDEDSSDSEQS
jgi:hypothetical protein